MKKIQKVLQKVLKKVLSKTDIVSLWRLLYKVNPLPNMQYEVLKIIWKLRLMPHITFDLIILKPGQDLFVTPLEELEVLLTKRAPNDPDFPNALHFPGGFLGSNEKVWEAVLRVMQKEIGVGVIEMTFAFQTNRYAFTRDHEYSSLLFIKPEDGLDLKSRQEFHPLVSSLPEATLPTHVELRDRAEDWLKTMHLIPEPVRNQLRVVNSVLECKLLK
ncbi:MAG: NUDIX hydrolase [bacterium]|nr:NUDIX hydrolase [bacterium]